MPFARAALVLRENVDFRREERTIGLLFSSRSQIHAGGDVRKLDRSLAADNCRIRDFDRDHTAAGSDDQFLTPSIGDFPPNGDSASWRAHLSQQWEVSDNQDEPDQAIPHTCEGT